MTRIIFFHFILHALIFFTRSQLSLETDAAGAEQLLDMLPCFILLTSLHIDISNTTHPPTLQHLVRTLTVTYPPPPPFQIAVFVVYACACALFIYTATRSTNLLAFSTRTFRYSHDWSLEVVMMLLSHFHLKAFCTLFHFFSHPALDTFVT